MTEHLQTKETKETKEAAVEFQFIEGGPGGPGDASHEGSQDEGEGECDLVQATNAISGIAVRHFEPCR